MGYMYRTVSICLFRNVVCTCLRGSCACLYLLCSSAIGPLDLSVRHLLPNALDGPFVEVPCNTMAADSSSSVGAGRDSSSAGEPVGATSSNPLAAGEHTSTASSTVAAPSTAEQAASAAVCRQPPFVCMLLTGLVLSGLAAFDLFLLQQMADTFLVVRCVRLLCELMRMINAVKLQQWGGGAVDADLARLVAMQMQRVRGLLTASGFSSTCVVFMQSHEVCAEMYQQLALRSEQMAELRAAQRMADGLSILANAVAAEEEEGGMDVEDGRAVGTL